MTSSNSLILQVEDLVAVFDDGSGRLQALDQVSFSIEPHQFVCVLGPSGSGKSTLLRILGGLLRATSGRVKFNGAPVLGPSRKVGFVFQDPNLMPWRTVLENITLPLEVTHISRDDANGLALDLIHLVGLEGFQDWMPPELSGGMAQRVAIARTLIYDPEVLLLDEPFGALDALTRERMGVELSRIWQISQKTVVMVTHSISEALLLADRILVLTPQPGTICLDMEVNLTRPRRDEIRYTPAFLTLERKLREAISEGDLFPCRD